MDEIASNYFELGRISKGFALMRKMRKKRGKKKWRPAIIGERERERVLPMRTWVTQKMLVSLKSEKEFDVSASVLGCCGAIKT